MAIQYKNPPTTPSTMGKQHQPHFYYKKALIETIDELFFTPLADTLTMPKNHGRTIVAYLYVPLLDDRNVNDQGIDAAGVTSANGNLYGSSRDIGYIQGKLPALSESGGRVNRVGFTRLEVTGVLQDQGFFFDYTRASLNFDSDEDLEMHLNREAIRGAQLINEDLLQIDLINNAGTVIHAGTAASTATIKDSDIVTYGNLLRLSIVLDNNHTPYKTKVLSGTRMTDTKTIAAARILFVGSALVPVLRAMKDLHNNEAFIPVHKYAAHNSTINGEIGSIDQFRIVQVPRMLEWTGGGAATSDPTIDSSGGNVTVHPMLAVGDESFTTIGFQTSGNTVKFEVIHKKPGVEIADSSNPYGRVGFVSIQWYYGFMALRAERIALLKTAARLA